MNGEDIELPLIRVEGSSLVEPPITGVGPDIGGSTLLGFSGVYRFKTRRGAADLWFGEVR
jgi:hypothetical protein